MRRKPTLEEAVFDYVRARFERTTELERELPARPDVVKSSPNSLPKVPFFPRSGPDDEARRTVAARKDLATRIRFAVQILPNILTSIQAARRAVRDLDKNPTNPRSEAPDSFFDLLEAKAAEFGAEGVGYTTLHPDAIFRDMAVLYPNVIVLQREMNRELIARGPGIGTYVMIHDTYARLSEATLRLTAFLREQGYGAHAGPPLGGITSYPVLGQDAGLGWIGTHGVLITPRFGPRLRLSAVYTSIGNLPVADKEKNPHRWIADYCRMCRKCVKVCPGTAVREQPLVHDNGAHTCIDVDRCRPFFYGNYGCTVCIRDCPFSRIPYDTLKRAIHKRKAS
jgi:Pyruvate/2-oxoacid:ferredoxin oxidoreductase delta subunit